MGNLKTKVRTVAKKAVAREVGRQVERVIKRNVKNADPRALDYTRKYAEKTALRYMGVKTSAPAKSSKQKNWDFSVKIGGMDKVAKDALKGRNIGKSIKNNAKIELKYRLRFGGKKR